jgi:hypothetical protein
MKLVGSDSGTDFEDWLERQFSKTLGSERGPKPYPAGARYAVASRMGGTRFMAVRSSVVAALSAKVIAGGAVAALAAGGATAAIAATGSLSPVSWGQHVVQAVEQCKDQLRAAQGTSRGDPDRGIGQCVSAVARQHGEQKRDQHANAAGDGTAPGPRPISSSSPGKHLGQTKNGSPAATASGSSAQTHGKGQGQAKGQGNGQGNGNGAAHGNGNPGHPTPAAGGG